MLPLLEIPDRKVYREKRSIQHQRGVPSLDLSATITPPLHDGPFTWGPHLGYPVYFVPFMGLGFFCSYTPSFLHYIFAFLFPLPLLVYRIRLRGLGKRRSKRLGLDDHLRHSTSNIRLQKLQKACLTLALQHHCIGDAGGFLDTTYLCRRKVAEINNWRLWKLKLVENFKVLLGDWDFNYFWCLVKSWLGRGRFFLSSALEGQVHLLCTFRRSVN